MNSRIAANAAFWVIFFSSNVAFAQTKVNLTQEDPQGLFWDAGESQWGGTDLQIYQAFLPNEPSQAFTWTQVANGWTVCSLSICLSDNGSQVVMGKKADVWNITSQNAVQNFTTRRYIEQPANPGNGSYLSTGYTPIAWKFTVAKGGGGHGAGGQYNIMPLGDSITEGYATSATFAQGGYRCPLYSLLTGSAVSFTFVGDSASLEPGTVTVCPDVNWEGHGGYDIGAIQSFEDADGTVRSLKPNIILLLAGTNDVAQGETGNIAAQLTRILNDLFYQDPNAWVVISTIPPINPSAPNAPPVEAFWASQVPFANAQIRATAALYPRTTLVDFYAATASNVNANIGSDGVHPTVNGYAILAGLWEGAIKNYINNGN